MFAVRNNFNPKHCLRVRERAFSANYPQFYFSKNDPQSSRAVSKYAAWCNNPSAVADKIIQKTAVSSISTVKQEKFQQKLHKASKVKLHC